MADGYSPDDRIAIDLMKVWQHDPAQYAWDVFRFKCDVWQKKVLSLLTVPQKHLFRIAMQACAGPGKSALEAIVAWWFLTTQADAVHHPQAFAISVTKENLRDGLWKELAVWRQRSELMTSLFEYQKERIYSREFPETWWLAARSFSKSADPETAGEALSGLHSRYIAYFIDESGGMATSIPRKAEQGLATADIVFGLILTGGNPTSQTGALYDVVNNGTYDVVRITGDPDDPERSTRISLEWAREQIKKYGRQNPWVMAFILGKFPPMALNALFAADDLRDAMERRLTADVYEYSQKRLGVDVARFGDDATILFPRQGLRAFKQVEMRNAKSHDIAGRIILAKHNWEWEECFIDETGGWAAGTIDACELAGHPLYPVNASSNALDRRFFNRRTECYWNMAEWIKTGSAWLPNCPEIIPQFTAVTYWLHNGQLRIVEKDQIKALLQGKSPDDADALAQTFALPDVAAAMKDLLPGTVYERATHTAHEGVGIGGVISDYDPLNR